jgi:hypothetical protein
MPVAVGTPLGPAVPTLVQVDELSEIGELGEEGLEDRVIAPGASVEE